MNIPNFLSLLRIFLIPLFLYLFFIPKVEPRIWALIVFGIASLTDLLDGWSARKLGQESDIGQFLDPFADKLLVIAALIAFLILDPLIPIWMIIVIVGRDILITLARYLAMKKNTVIKTSKFGKIKTAFQMISIIIIIMVFIVRSSMESIPHQIIVDGYLKYNSAFQIYNSINPNKWLILGPYCLMTIVTLLTALSGLRYIITNRDLFSIKKNNITTIK